MWCGVKSGSEWLSTEQPVRHNTGHQQSLPHTGYQHGTALDTRSVLQETSSKPGSGQSERRCTVKTGDRSVKFRTCLCGMWSIVAGMRSANAVFSHMCLSLGWPRKNFTCYKFKIWPGVSECDLPTSFWSSWREDLIRSRRAVSCFFSSSWVCLIWGGQMQGWGKEAPAELRDYQLCLHRVVYCIYKNYIL